MPSAAAPAGTSGCSDSITIASPDSALTVAANEVANVGCADDSGEILVAPTGGVPPYDIVLTNTTTAQVYNVTGVPSFVFDDLSSGTFTVQVTDANGCIAPGGLTLTAPNPITAGISASTTMLLCYGDTNATVSATGTSGGVADKRYLCQVFADDEPYVTMAPFLAVFDDDAARELVPNLASWSDAFRRTDDLSEFIRDRAERIGDAARPVRGVDHRDLAARRLQLQGRGEAGDARAHHHRADLRGRHTVFEKIREPERCCSGR